MIEKGKKGVELIIRINVVMNGSSSAFALLGSNSEQKWIGC